MARCCTHIGVSGFAALLAAMVTGAERLEGQTAPPPATAPAFPLPGGDTLGQVPAGTPIATVKFEGLVNVAQGYMLSIVQTRAGDGYAAATVNADIDRLLRTAKFDDVVAVARMEAGRAVVVFTVIERATIESVEITGNEKFKTKDLMTEAGLNTGQPISEYTIKRAKDAIERKYKAAGYYYAKVESDSDAVRTGRMVIRVTEGLRVKIRGIEFDGAVTFAPSVLKEKIETRTYIWIFRKGELDDERVARDDVSLAAFYRDEGFLDAKVTHELKFDDSGKKLTLRFQIVEGTRYAIKTLKVVGASVFAVEELRSVVKLSEGMPLRAEQIKLDVKAIRDKYGAAGYVYAESRADWVYVQNEAGLVDLTYSMTLEGRQYRIGRVIVRGNRRTQDKVVRRELNFKPTELYDTTATEAGQNRLQETRLFTDATITPIGDEPDTRDALVDVKEADTVSILFSVGVTSNSGLVGGITLENRNFDLFDPPRNSTEFFSGRALKGAGQTMRISGEPGTELNRFRIDFREPYMFDQPYGYTQSVYLFQRRYEEYDDQRIGLNTIFDHRFKTGPLRNWAAEIGFRIEQVDIDDTDFLSDDDIQDVRGKSWLTSVKGALIRNTTDSIFVPSKGSRFAVSWEQYGALGGDYSFSKVIADYSKYFTVHTDVVDRKHVLALGGTIGNIFGDGPVFERFYAGGIGALRGFAFRGVSPRGGRFFRDDEAIGGDFELLANAEYSFPIFGTPSARSVALRGVGFLDMGTVETDVGITDWRSSVGVGARIYIPFFGPIPLSFDFAFPVTKNDDDDTQVFSFSFGTTF